MTVAPPHPPARQPTLRLDAEPAPLWRYLSPVALVATLWRHRVLLRQLARSNVSAGTRGHLLGRTWVVLDPLILLAVYGFVFGMIFYQRPGVLTHGPAGFVLSLYGGMLAYQVFASSANQATATVTAARLFVKQLVFPVEILPAATVGGVLIGTSIGMVLLLIATAIFGQGLSWVAVFLPVVLVPVVLMALGMAWLVASLGVYIPDVRKIVSVVTQVGFFLTPIIWPLAAFPEKYRWVVHLNPLTVVVESVRDVTLRQQMPDWPALATVTLLAVVVCQIGYAFFMKTKRGFADVL